MNTFKLTQARDRLSTALSYGKDMESSARVCISDAMELLATVDEFSSKLKRKILVVDLRLHDMSGKLTARVVDALTNETIITNDLLYCLNTIRERGYEFVDAKQVLETIVKSFFFKRTGGMK